MACEVLLTANAGVVLTLGGRRVLIDALHCRGAEGFSSLSPSGVSALWNLLEPAPPELVLITHAHPDHADPALLEEAARRWPEAVFLSPDGAPRRAVRLTGPAAAFSFGGLRVEARRLPHEGEALREVPHYGFLLTLDGFSVLAPGDCATGAAGALAGWVGERRVDLALLNFPWLTLEGPRRFVRARLGARRVCLLHLPFQEDDRWGYRRAACTAAAQYGPDAAVLCKPFQRAEIPVG